MEGILSIIDEVASHEKKMGVEEEEDREKRMI